ncbi:MAG: phage holin family protein [Bacteroidales bacterium]|nr:phage holin family protein [Bacteroidales bacterium]
MELSEDNKYQDFTRKAKDYIKTRYDLLKLELLEKTSRILSVLIMIIISLFLLLGALIYFSFALVSWMETVFGSMIPGFLIIGGVFLIILFLVYIFREKILINPLIRAISKILFEEKESGDDDE